MALNGTFAQETFSHLLSSTSLLFQSFSASASASASSAPNCWMDWVGGEPLRDVHRAVLFPSSPLA